MESIEMIEIQAARHEALGLKEFVYWRRARPGINPVEAWNATHEAFQRAEGEHEDFEKFSEEMSFMACWLVPVWHLISLDRYIEVLYCAAKYSRLARGMRALRIQPTGSVQ